MFAAAGTGPRHLVFHPNHQYAYLVGELDSSLTVLRYNEADGSFEEIKKYRLYQKISPTLIVGLLSEYQKMDVSFIHPIVDTTLSLSLK